jgi:DNA anti-recombination protein RmuC
MSDDISITRFNNTKEAMNRRQAMEIRRLEEKNQKLLTKTKEATDAQSQRIEKDFEIQMNAEKSDYDKKLTDIRQKHTKRLTEENAKFEASLQDLKQAQESRLAEIRGNNEAEVQRTLDDHKEYMERARLRFEEQKKKAEA